MSDSDWILVRGDQVEVITDPDLIADLEALEEELSDEEEG